MRKKAIEEIDIELEPATVVDGPAKGGIIRSLFRLVTLPFRLVAGVVRIAVVLVTTVVKIVLIPFRLAFAAIMVVVGIAADITFALWRVVLKLIGIIVGTVKFFLGVLNATIGGAIRLVFRIVFGSLKLLLRVFTLGKLFGRATAKSGGKKGKGSVADTLDLAA